MSAICSEISSVALAVWLAAICLGGHHAKPLPASPARAASMVGGSAPAGGLGGNGIDQADDFRRSGPADFASPAPCRRFRAPD